MSEEKIGNMRFLLILVVFAASSAIDFRKLAIESGGLKTNDDEGL